MRISGQHLMHLLVCTAVVIACASAVKGTTVLMAAQRAVARAEELSCITSSSGLGLGSDARLLVYCGQIASAHATYETCVQALKAANSNPSTSGLYPSALVEIDLLAADSSVGHAAAVAARLVSTKQLSRLALTVLNLSPTLPDLNIELIASIVLSIQAVAVENSNASVVLYFPKPTNLCAPGGLLYSETKNSMAKVIGTLNQYPEAFEVGIAFPSLASVGSDSLCGFDHSVFLQGPEIPALPFSAGACASSFDTQSPARTFGSHQLANQTAEPSSLSQSFVLQTGLSLGMLGVARSLNDVPRMRNAACLSNPGWSPDGGPLDFAVVECGAQSFMSRSAALACRKFVQAVQDSDQVQQVAVLVNMGLSPNSSMPSLQNQAAFTARALSGQIINQVVVHPLFGATSTANNTRNLAQLSEYLGALAALFQPKDSATTLSVSISVPVASCSDGGAWAASGTDTVQSVCASHTRLSCGFADLSSLVRPTALTAVCGFDADTVHNALFVYLPAEAYADQSCVGVASTRSALFALPTSAQLPQAHSFDLGVQLGVVTADAIDKPVASCLVGAIGLDTPYQSIECGSAANATKILKCEQAIATFMSAARTVRLLPRVEVPVSGLRDISARHAAQLALKDGVVGMQYAFELSNTTSSAASTIGNMITFLQAVSSSLYRFPSPALTQFIVLEDANACAPAPAAGGDAGALYVSAASSPNASLYAQLTANVDASEWFLVLPNATVPPNADVVGAEALCGFPASRIVHKTPLLPEYSGSCAPLLTLTHVSSLVAPPQTFAPQRAALGIAGHAILIPVSSVATAARSGCLTTPPASILAASAPAFAIVGCGPSLEASAIAQCHGAIRTIVSIEALGQDGPAPQAYLTVPSAASPAEIGQLVLGFFNNGIVSRMYISVVFDKNETDPVQNVATYTNLLQATERAVLNAGGLGPIPLGVALPDSSLCIAGNATESKSGALISNSTQITLAAALKETLTESTVDLIFLEGGRPESSQATCGFGARVLYHDASVPDPVGSCASESPTSSTPYTMVTLDVSIMSSSPYSPKATPGTQGEDAPDFGYDSGAVDLGQTSFLAVALLAAFLAAFLS